MAVTPNKVYPIAVTIYEIFTNEIKSQKFDRKNEGQEGENGTCTIPL